MTDRSGDGGAPQESQRTGGAIGLTQTLKALEQGVTDLAAIQIEIVQARIRQALVRAGLLAVLAVAGAFTACAAILFCLSGLASLFDAWLGHPGLGSLLAGVLALGVIVAALAGLLRMDRRRRLDRQRSRFEGDS
jgi:hypothetical protein